MNIVFFGNGPRGVACLEALLKAGERIVAVVGHGGDQPTDVVACAADHGLATHQPAQVNDPAFIEQLQTLQPELFCLVGYNRILKADIIAVPTRGCINCHGGRLPDYRGCAPINWQIINGATVGGCCVLYVDEGIDTGDIIEQALYPIGPDETSADIVARTLQLFPPMLARAVRAIREGTVQAVPQDPKAGRYYTRRYPRDGQLNWDLMDAEQVRNLVRALADPYPNAFTWYQGRKLRIRRVERVTPPVIGIPGRVPLKRPEGIIVCCRDAAVLITETAWDDDGEPFNPRPEIPIGADFTWKQKGELS